MPDFDEVYRLYFRDVYRYALSLCRNEAAAEEVTQETFFKALKQLDRYRGECSLYVWLCQIAKNTWFSLCRRNRTADFPEEAELPDTAASMEERLTDRETVLAVHRILHDLEEPYKEVFSLRTFGELSFRQIGELFGKTENWARVAYHRAKLKILSKLEED